MQKKNFWHKVQVAQVTNYRTAPFQIGLVGQNNKTAFE